MIAIADERSDDFSDVAATLVQMDEPDLAIEPLQHAVDLYPGQLDLCLRLVALLLQQGDSGSARDYLQRFGARANLPAHLRQADDPVLGDVAEVAGQREFAAATHRGTVDCRDYGLRHVL